MENEPKLKELTAILNEYSDLKNAGDLLSWDQQTNMPPGGAADRGYQMGTLAKLAHTTITNPVVGQLLEQLQPWAEGVSRL